MIDLLTAAVGDRPVAPPRQLSTPDHETVMIVIAAAVLAGILVLSLRTWVREHDALGFFLVLGGCVASLQEPIVDVLGNIWLRTDTPLFETFGRPIPVWGVLAYGCFYGGLAFSLYRASVQGATRRRVRNLILAVFVVNTMCEPILIALDLYVYYGEAPFRIFEFPVYWSFINTAGIVVGAAAVARNRQVFDGWRGALALFVLPVTVPADSLASGLPVFSALNAGESLPDAFLWAGAIATAVIATIIVNYALKLLIPDAPSNTSPHEAATDVAPAAVGA